MISGKVLPTGEAVIWMKVRGANGPQANVEAYVDTGFNDELTLPHWVIERLQLPFFSEVSYSTADGTDQTARMYACEVQWMGAWRTVWVTEVDRDPLVGMLLMKGCHLGIDVIDEGRVEIRPLEGAAN